MMNSLYRLPAVLSATGLSRATIYLRISQGLFVPPVKLGARAVGFPSREVDAVNAARIAGKTDAQIRELVTHLCGQRHETATA